MAWNEVLPSPATPFTQDAPFKINFQKSKIITTNLNQQREF
jgi:hypothetical protein